MEPDPLDVILMVKEWPCSDSLSQAPMVLLPKKIADSLDPTTLRTQIKKRLSQREAQETETYFPSHLDCKRDVLLFPILCISQVPEDSHECVDGAVVFLPSCSVLAWSGGV